MFKPSLIHFQRIVPHNRPLRVDRHERSHQAVGILSRETLRIINVGIEVGVAVGAVHFFHTHRIERVATEVADAERLGFAHMFMVEHHFTGQGQVSASMTLLSYLAAKTERIRLGTAVVVLPWHNPVLIAEQAATLDLLSGGRFDFGVGKGYRDLEYKGFNIPKEDLVSIK